MVQLGRSEQEISRFLFAACSFCHLRELSMGRRGPVGLGVVLVASSWSSDEMLAPFVHGEPKLVALFMSFLVSMVVFGLQLLHDRRGCLRVMAKEPYASY